MYWEVCGHCRQTLSGMLSWKHQAKILWILWWKVSWHWHLMMAVWMIWARPMCLDSVWCWSVKCRWWLYMAIMPTIIMSVKRVCIFTDRHRNCPRQRIFWWCSDRIRNIRYWKRKYWMWHWCFIWNTAAVITLHLRPMWWLHRDQIPILSWQQHWLRWRGQSMAGPISRLWRWWVIWSTMWRTQKMKMRSGFILRNW